jgi:LmeA-like phospholipid-binding
MTRQRVIPWWDPFRPLDLVSTGTAATLWTVFVTLRRVVIGRRVTVQAGSSPVTMTVSELESHLDLRRLTFGQLDDVRIAATDIDWGTNRFGHASAVLRNVHIRAGAPPVVVAAPVHLTFDVPTDALDGLFLAIESRFAGAIGDDGVARVRWARRPRLGQMEVDVQLDGSALLLTPRAVILGGRRWKLPKRTPARRLRLPQLPHGLQLTDVRFQPGLLRLTGSLPEWRMDLSRRNLELLAEF